MSIYSTRQPPPVPPRRKVPVGLTVNEYNQKRSAERSANSAGSASNAERSNGEFSREDDMSVGGVGGGLNAARKISQNSQNMLYSQSESNISNKNMNTPKDQINRSSSNDDEIRNVPDSVIGAGVDIKGTMAFKR